MAERADAARNRRAILRAAEDLIAASGPEHVSIERVAADAGVGKGTVFHRFTNRAGLMRALAMERISEFQQAWRGGPPPLGPGAPARARLTAFLDAVVELSSRNVSLLAAYEHASGHRQDNPIYVEWHGHIRELIAEARPDLDAEVVAHILLGALSSDLIVHMLRDGEAERLSVSLRQLADALLGEQIEPPAR
ncbi:TetR/AcrR family transcriptional regulator [Amycolatopsis alkalitolerans]|uniref:Helix-turn-helix transcriptional regulator n=1 Tax=Amycolatopsis alkalitolerans TaxID=2547244 RepID=A0A5C4M341_9PSEU|nr:TetR/AcrR family transcriptional regulator [Amycolatopsis alkalitolerans]TNC26157.1 helix-turn-helix transcriptional regulator [Amycolatopsis alkalitolerans]